MIAGNPSAQHVSIIPNTVFVNPWAQTCWTFNIDRFLDMTEIKDSLECFKNAGGNVNRLLVLLFWFNIVVCNNFKSRTPSARNASVIENIVLWKSLAQTHWSLNIDCHPTWKNQSFVGKLQKIVMWRGCRLYVLNCTTLQLPWDTIVSRDNSPNQWVMWTECRLYCCN